MFAMWNCENQKAVGERQKAENSSALCGDTRRHEVFLCLLLFAFCLLAGGCRRDMQDQPKAIAYRESSFFKNGLSSRPLVEGTVPRGYLRADREYYQGKKSIIVNSQVPILTQPTGAQATAPSTVLPTAPVSLTALYPDDVDAFPFPMPKDVMNR